MEQAKKCVALKTASDLVVTTQQPELIDQAQTLAAELKIPFGLTHSECPLQLVLTPKGLVLHQTQEKYQFYLDFCEGSLAFRLRQRAKLRLPLARAIGLKAAQPLIVMDVTAGWARDALLLASLGCTMVLIERSRVVAAMLQEALQRLQRVQSLPITLHQDEAQGYLKSLPSEAYPDVIYLDPMYPPRRKSALVKKEMRLLQQLVGEDLDSSELFETALRCATKRVVVKRPKSASFLAGYSPDFSIKSPNTRYDVYLLVAR